MKLLLYCTKGKPYLYKSHMESPNKYYTFPNNRFLKNDTLNGKIVGECDYEVEEIYNNSIPYHTHSFNQQELLSECCLSVCELDDYLKGENGYAIHIENLKIFDEPRDLFHYTCVKGPRNMQYVYSSYDKDRNALISIQPQWLCKILNGEKTIEVRKKLLKGMLENE